MMEMVNYVQTTDSKLVFPYSSKIIPDKSYAEHETDDVGTLSSFLSSPYKNELISNAWDVAVNHSNQNIVSNSKKLLLTIQKTVSIFQLYKFEIGNLPKLHAFIEEDGSLLIEWTFGQFRIGFNFDNENSDSSWYFVSLENIGNINAYGSLSDVNEKTIFWLINFAITHI